MRPILSTCVLAASALLGCHPRAAPTAPAAASSRCQPAASAGDGQHDFDFEFGRWTAKLSRRLRPLTGSDEWVAYEGTSVVHPLWQGRANVGELDVSGAAGRIEGLTCASTTPPRAAGPCASRTAATVS